MSRVRIKGLVRLARRAQAALRVGFEPGEREPFLERTRASVEQADTILADLAAGAGDLPAPSRNALATLRRIASLEADDLPAADASPGPRPVALENIVATMNRCLDRLADGCPDAAVRQAVGSEARSAADAIERLSAEQGSHPGGLPAASRKAYAMLRWLATGENLERYVGQVRLARRAIESVLGPLIGEERLPELPVRFRLGQTRARRIRPGEPMPWHIGARHLAADAADLEAMVRWLVFGRTAPAAAVERHRRFIDSPAAGQMELELRRLADPVPFHAKGIAHDLDALFERLNRRFFDGALARPHLHWEATLSRRRFGLYDAATDLVRLNPILDDPEIPAFVVESVLYHELLHKVHGVACTAGRRQVHPPAFRADERRNPRHGEAERWLAVLASGRSRPAEPSDDLPGGRPARAASRRSASAR